MASSLSKVGEMTGTNDPISIGVPQWVSLIVSEHGPALDTDERRMSLAVRLARENVERGGGPFGAVVFAGERIVSAGVNRVLETGYSIAHAEIVAISKAQQAASALEQAPRMSLFTSTEPCCQCFGAIVWSGICRLVCGATTEDAEAIGFDEGPKPDRWPALLEARGIEVALGANRVDARNVLELYRRRGGRIYGPGAAPREV